MIKIKFGTICSIIVMSLLNYFVNSQNYGFGFYPYTGYSNGYGNGYGGAYGNGYGNGIRYGNSFGGNIYPNYGQYPYYPTYGGGANNYPCYYCGNNYPYYSNYPYNGNGLNTAFASSNGGTATAQASSGFAG